MTGPQLPKKRDGESSHQLMLFAHVTFTTLVNGGIWLNVLFHTPDAPYFARRLETVLEWLLVASVLWIAISKQARHSKLVWILLAANAVTWWFRPAFGG